MPLNSFSPNDPSDPDTETPSAEESAERNVKVIGGELHERPHSEGNANIPECKNGYDVGSDDDLASKGLLGKRGRKK